MRKKTRILLDKSCDSLILAVELFNRPQDVVVEPRGEFTLVIKGAPAAARWDESEVRAALHDRMTSGLTPSEAAREVADKAGWKRREVYRLTLEDT